MNALTHARREIEAAWRFFVLNGTLNVPVRPEILRSWQRVRGEWHVDPALQTCPAPAGGHATPGSDADEAFRLASPLVRHFAERLAPDGHVVAYFDARGVMLDIEGNHRTRGLLADVNFARGACWAEESAGTNGPGTALAERRPIEVFASEHFVEAWQPWTCASVPVRFRGAILGVVDITSPWAAHNPTLLPTAEALARAIEAQLEATAAHRRSAILCNVAEQAVRAREAFLSVASHELKTPLTPLSLKLQMLRRLLERRGSAVDARELMDVLRGTDEYVLRLAEFFDDLIKVSATVGGPPRLALEATDLGFLARRVVERHRADLEQHGCHINVSAAADVLGHWDRARLEEALRQLLLNAMKHAPGPIDVVVEAEPLTARLLVRDRGPGIAPHDQERVFLPFERAVSYQNVSGFGLGLHVVRQVVEAHGGGVRVESALGEGSTFIMELPLPGVCEERLLAP